MSKTLAFLQVLLTLRLFRPPNERSLTGVSTRVPSRRSWAPHPELIRFQRHDVREDSVRSRQGVGRSGPLCHFPGWLDHREGLFGAQVLHVRGSNMGGVWVMSSFEAYPKSVHGGHLVPVD